MNPSFFDQNESDLKRIKAPLADRMRPKTLEEFVGQEHIAAPGKLLNRMIAADKISSIILYGPAGCGKTTLAEIIANTTKSQFVKLNAVTSGVKDIKEVIDGAKKDLGQYYKRTILFIDEIHRFNKSQQDALLPAVEDGTVILIGATTENPHFEINSALVSRSTVFQLYPLNLQHVMRIIKNAISDEVRGYGQYKIDITDEAVTHMANISGGDARIALNALELAFLTTEKDKDGIIKIDLETAQECIQKRAVKYDKSGDEHYDTISAFIKSMRGSDPNAAVYWLSKMLYAGEDPKFIARRMVIFASEDISNADPNALNVAVSVFRAVEIIGLPECQLNLAHGATYLALAPKSNASCIALKRASSDIAKYPTAPVPAHLKSTGHSKNREFGNGIGYKYPHDFENHYVKQDYLPEEFKARNYYEPDGMGYEEALLKDWKERKG